MIRKVSLAFGYFTAEPSPTITAMTITGGNHSVKEPRLITSRWSQHTFEKGPCSLIPLTLWGGVKWIVSQQLKDPAGQSMGPLVAFWSSLITPCRGQRPITRTAPVLGHNLWSDLWYATVSDGGTRIASSLPDIQETSERERGASQLSVLHIKIQHDWPFLTFCSSSSPFLWFILYSCWSVSGALFKLVLISWPPCSWVATCFWDSLA